MIKVCIVVGHKLRSPSPADNGDVTTWNIVQQDVKQQKLNIKKYIFTDKTSNAWQCAPIDIILITIKEEQRSYKRGIWTIIRFLIITRRPPPLIFYELKKILI